jgi:hypothetical protein
MVVHHSKSSASNVVMGHERPICDTRTMSASPPEAAELLRGIK